MPLVNMQRMLASARQDGWAVAAFNPVDYASMKAVIQAAAELDAPVIVQTSAKTWPVSTAQRDELIATLHRWKTDLFMEIIESGELPVRPGINRIVDAVDDAGVRLAVCSTSNERAVTMVVRRLLGPEREKKFAGIFAGDIVPKKKPDPAVYRYAAQRLDLDPARCVVVEDSRNGLLAAGGAGMTCVVTRSAYTAGEDFAEAVAVYPELGDPPGKTVSLDELKQTLAKP